MAKAPSPAKLAAQRTRAEQPYITITDPESGQSAELRFDQLGPGDERLAREACGVPVSRVFTDGYVQGADTVLMLWWIARRKNGEPSLTYEQVEAECPTLADIGRLEITITTPDDDPEG